MFRVLFAALLICGGIFIAPPARANTNSPTGSWLTANGQAVIAIAPCGPALCGHIAGIALHNPADPQPRDWRGQPQCGDAIIIANPSDTPDRWVGTVTDPRSGNVFHATLTMRDGTLHMRGYAGLPLFGETQIWTRYTGQIRTGCIITDVE